MDSSTFEPLIVVAFDFGTTYSGYGFAFKHNPLDVFVKQTWPSSSDTCLSHKTPTCVLLNPDKTFHSFGYEAENKYASLIDKKESKDWFFFRNFKMLLHNREKLFRETKLTDISGKEMPAMDIFSMSIRYLRQDFLQELKDRSAGVRESDILYVLTVPTMWAESAKQFMREAAVQAGIDTMRLKLALEPEAAALWCKDRKELISPGMQFMVIDLGGGTADIICFSKNKDETLKQLYLATGGPWGGACVERNYLKTLENLFGETALEYCETDKLGEYFDLLRDFERKKRSLDPDCAEHVTFTVPYSLRNSMSCSLGTPEERFVSQHVGKVIVIIGDKMKLDASIVRSWFDKPVDDLISHIKYILSRQEVKEVQNILLVGGFSECRYVQEKLKKEIKDKHFIIQYEASLAVLKGAVTYGFHPNAVSIRVMKYSYGIETVRDYDKKKDSQEDVVVIDGKEKIDHIFSPFVRAGDSVKVGHPEKKSCKPIGDKESLVNIYRSRHANTEKTTDCERIGTLRVLLPQGHQIKKFETEMVFGLTELIVKAKLQKKSEEEFHAVFDCLM